MGPSWYLMPDLFEKFFKEIGENIHDHLDLAQLSPSYKVFYPEDNKIKDMNVYADIDRMADQFEQMEV
jgi:phytoene dehydrogenase-like protein